MASMILLTLILNDNEKRMEMFNLNRAQLKDLILYGFVFITLTQGLQFVALELLPAITISFILNFSVFVVVVFSTILLKEKPNRNQIIIMIIAIFGGVIYFYPFSSFDITVFGSSVLIAVLLANSLSQIIGRQVNRSNIISPFVITGVSMFIGAIILFIGATMIEKFEHLSWKNIIIILWLAIVNTAFAFTLWNDAMRQLKAYEITIINNTMLPQITILAIIFLDENPSSLQWISIFVIIVTAFLVLSLTNTDKKEQK
ncbi:MAG: putative inner membrane transporter yiJE [Candidatus Heimdallarchaeota archaeon LC_2]|nr:MAG: putative inner membrane transporter yiJE [Candidatus Heimdallarchaeota archaeon LC_2]